MEHSGANPTNKLKKLLALYSGSLRLAFRFTRVGFGGPIFKKCFIALQGLYKDSPKLVVFLLGVPIKRIAVLWGLYWGPSICESRHVQGNLE